ncbi:hypothetical protein [Desulfofustis glycolicus]|nr:hypothetical protein [Desulfofustis glycolicus]MCB2217487.1 hypothetical protein [Desulfobulbaceae bacterium]
MMESPETSSRRSDNHLKLGANIVLCLVILFLVSYGIKRVAEAPDVVGLLEQSVVPGPRVATIGDQLELVDYRLDLHQIGNRVQAVFTVANNGDRQLRDPAIDCELFDRFGERRGVDRWVIYDTVPARSEESYVLEKQSYVSPLVDPATVTCRIVDIHGPARPLVVHEQNRHHH